jgi:hypothetical protein
VVLPVLRGFICNGKQAGEANVSRLELTGPGKNGVVAEW